MDVKQIFYMFRQKAEEITPNVKGIGYCPVCETYHYMTMKDNSAVCTNCGTISGRGMLQKGNGVFLLTKGDVFSLFPIPQDDWENACKHVKEVCYDQLKCDVNALDNFILNSVKNKNVLTIDFKDMI